MENTDSKPEEKGGGIGIIVIFVAVVVALLVALKFLMN